MAPRARTTPFVRPGRGRGGRGGLVWKPNLLHLVHRSVYYDLFQYEYYKYVTHRTNIFTTTTTTVRVLTQKHPCIDDFRKINKVRTCGTLVRTRAPRTHGRVPFVFVLCSWFVCTNSVVYENPAASLQPLVARSLRSFVPSFDGGGGGRHTTTTTRVGTTGRDARATLEVFVKRTIRVDERERLIIRDEARQGRRVG